MSWHADEHCKVQQEEAAHTRCQQGRGMQMHIIMSGRRKQSTLEASKVVAGRGAR